MGPRIFVNIIIIIVMLCNHYFLFISPTLTITPTTTHTTQTHTQVILDENVLAHEHEYMDLSSCAPSPDHTLLAYAVSTVYVLCAVMMWCDVV